MPNRIVRDGILYSVPVSQLTPEAELLYRKLMSVADDFGRFYASPPQILMSSCYPLQIGRITEKDIEKWLKELKKNGLVDVYDTGGKKVLEIIKFNQRRRANKSKFPSKTGSNQVNCNTDGSPMTVTGQSGGSQVTAEYEYEDESESENEDDSVSRKTALSKNWEPNDTHKKIALQESVNLNKAEDIFRDWAHGHKRIDWNRTFSNALRNEQWMKKQAPAKLDLGADGLELKRIKRR